MKRLLISLLVPVLTWFAAMPAQAQVSFGINGGVQLMEMNYNADVLRSSNRVGYFIGPTVVFSLPVSALSVDVAALYNRRDLRFYDNTFTQERLLIPAHLRVGTSLLDKLGVCLFAGPQFCCHLGRSTEQWKDADGNNRELVIQENTLCFDLGLALRIGKIEGSITYNLPLGKTADLTWQEIGQQLQSESWAHARSRTNAWCIAATYYF